MKLGMKLTIAIFLAFLVGLGAGGAWLRYMAGTRVRDEARGEAHRALAGLAPLLAVPVASGDRSVCMALLEVAAAGLPGATRVEAVDRTGTRLASIGSPPPPGELLDHFYQPLHASDGSLVGTLEALVGTEGLEARISARVRPGGTALFVSLMVTWILAEVLAAVIVLSPIKKVHRALRRAVRRGGPVDLRWLREELRVGGSDELEEMVADTLALVEAGKAPGSEAATPTSTQVEENGSRPPSHPGRRLRSVPPTGS